MTKDAAFRGYHARAPHHKKLDMQIQPGTIITTRALLFDMDGTLTNSTAVVERVWGRWAASQGVDFKDFVHRIHGCRAVDIMAMMAPPGADLAAELQKVDAQELIETDGIVPVAGAPELIAALPRASWALVTSASPELARTRMGAAGLPMPQTLVTANDVRQGKPDPACYRLALERLGLAAGQAVVVEDAPAGIAAGRAAGCRTIALATTSPASALSAEDWLPDLRHLKLDAVLADGSLRLRVV